MTWLKWPMVTALTAAVAVAWADSAGAGDLYDDLSDDDHVYNTWNNEDDWFDDAYNTWDRDYGHDDDWYSTDDDDWYVYDEPYGNNYWDYDPYYDPYYEPPYYEPGRGADRSGYAHANPNEYSYYSQDWYADENGFDDWYER